MQSCHSFLVGLFLLLLIDKPSTIIASCQHQKCDHTVGPTKIVELVNLDSDFENGQINPWVEQSESGVKWRVENKILPWEPSGNVAPTPPNGSNYLRVDRGAALSFGVAVLRSQTFTLGSDIEVSFSFFFWIRSKWPQFTNLELYLAKNGNEVLLLNLYEYSHINNRVWQSQTVSITDDSSSDLTLVFYAYCGTNAEDAVAIDDLRFISSQQSASTVSTTLTKTSLWTTATPVTSSTTSTGTTVSTTSNTSITSTTPTTSTSSNDFELTENSTDPITSTISTELLETSTPGTKTVETSPPAITTISATPLPTTSDQTTTVITEETTTEEQSTAITSSSHGSAVSTESTDVTDAITTTTEPTTTILEGGDCPSFLEGNTKMPCWTLGGKCYCFFTDTIGKNWISADLFCKDKGMSLLSLETVEEDKLIYDHIKITQALNSGSYWTSGMYSLDGDKIWEWTSTEPFQPFTYVNWSPGQPDNNGPGYCLSLDLIKTFSAGYWADIFCTNSFRFICESIN